jgi:RNA polymerase sigma factor (sigma-70 family)
MAAHRAQKQKIELKASFVSLVENSLSVFALTGHLCGNMMKPNSMSFTALNDADLVKQSLSGDREAFSQIVSRYQNLVCALAYNATGNLNQSEDFAQETFLAAWKQLANLREPQKLRSWLCAIARNLVNNTRRRQTRDPAHEAESLEEISESHSPELLPVEHAITNEEETILWRSLERIPETYREPLILFYREHQSIEQVAQALELNEDAVSQRLSRGRKLLHEQVLAFVEGALEKTAPGKTFTRGVMAALPTGAISIKTTTIGTTVAKISTAAKIGATLGSVIGFLPLLGSLHFNFKQIFEAAGQAKSLRERQFMVRFYRMEAILFVIFIPVMIGLFTHVSFAHNKAMFVLLVAFFLSAPLACLFLADKYARRRRRQIQIEDGTWVKSEPMTREQRKEYFDKLHRNGSKARVYFYLGMACLSLVGVMVELKNWDGHGNDALLLLPSAGVAGFLFFKAWRCRPR